jgi:hypothetical protein
VLAHSLHKATYPQKRDIDKVLSRMVCAASPSDDDVEPPPHLTQESGLLRHRYPPEEQTLAVVPLGPRRTIPVIKSDGWADTSTLDVNALDLTPPQVKTPRRTQLHRELTSDSREHRRPGMLEIGAFSMKDMLNDDSEMTTPSPATKAKAALEEIFESGDLSKNDLTAASRKASKGKPKQAKAKASSPKQAKAKAKASSPKTPTPGSGKTSGTAKDLQTLSEYIAKHE